jgi:hypothetical protein
LVKEHINEKFEKDSDPIEDLGIGIFKAMKNWFDSKENILEFFYDQTDLLWIFVKYNKKNFVKYILSLNDPVYFI